MQKLKLQDYNGAIEDFNKAIELNPEDSLTYCIRGSARSELRDYIGALKDINIGIESQILRMSYAKTFSDLRLQYQCFMSFKAPM